MTKQYTIENVEDLRKKINRDYLIRLTFPKERKRIVVGFTKFCEMVGANIQMAKDKDYIKLIHTPRWLRLRRDTLTAHPLCERCQAEGYITTATEVHHRKPVEDGINYTEKYRLMYDPKNLCALCHGCHVKTHTEMGRSGKEATRRRNAEQVRAVIVKFFNAE